MIESYLWILSETKSNKCCAATTRSIASAVTNKLTSSNSQVASLCSAFHSSRVSCRPLFFPSFREYSQSTYQSVTSSLTTTMSTFGTPSTSSRPSSIAPNDFNVPSAGNDGISSLEFSPTSNLLISGNWDGGVRCWDVQTQPPPNPNTSGQIMATPKAQANHEQQSPVLGTCFSSDGSRVFSAGVDKAVRMWQLGQPLNNNIPQQIGVHDAPVKAVKYLPRSNMVVSGGWDRKLKFWDTRQPNPAGVIDMPERVYAMDVQDSLLVVATANRQVISYNVQGQPQEISRKESPLKFQTRCVTCFPDTTGFAIGSIEGRVGIHYLQKVAGKESFAFKCHRQDVRNRG